MRAAEKAKPLAAQVALHAILIGIVSELSEPAEIRDSASFGGESGGLGGLSLTFEAVPALPAIIAR